MGVQSSAGTKGNTHVPSDVVDPYGSSMAGGQRLRRHGFSVRPPALVAAVTSHFRGWSGQSVMTAGSGFLGTDAALRRRQGKESVVRGRRECMHDLRSTERSVSNAGGMRSEMWVASVARIRGVYDAHGIH